MKSTVLRLARSTSAPPPLPKFFKDSNMSLAHFMVRGQVISLYRDILRCTKGLDKQSAREIRDFARADFERYRNERDLDKIRSLLSSGKQQMHSLKASVDLAHASR
ncbi:predicted protein [Lichtheimia corymbifera JMRC:FSU:9682]|uniref:LYR motif-containing protein 2 n=1 Tax=Lichtheimia corymbifera JMRC:FSU:9682 TaxID=1263082 RepID=A0A068RNT9_9FUNG|nr:predicted protein [Lichtheimia corymbifera JMRC:FSU:9682]